jgi:hypothetical protein
MSNQKEQLGENESDLSPIVPNNLQLRTNKETPVIKDGAYQAFTKIREVIDNYQNTEWASDHNIIEVSELLLEDSTKLPSATNWLKYQLKERRLNERPNNHIDNFRLAIKIDPEIIPLIRNDKNPQPSNYMTKAKLIEIAEYYPYDKYPHLQKLLVNYFIEQKYEAEQIKRYVRKSIGIFHPKIEDETTLNQLIRTITIKIFNKNLTNNQSADLITIENSNPAQKSIETSRTEKKPTPNVTPKNEFVLRERGSQVIIDRSKIPWIQDPEKYELSKKEVDLLTEFFYGNGNIYEVKSVEKLTTMKIRDLLRSAILKLGYFVPPTYR